MTLSIFIGSAVLFFISVLLVQLEERNDRRYFAGRFRAFLDRKISVVAHRFDTHWKHLSRYILQLGWYYSVHSLLRTILTVLVSVYDRIERIFEKNRSRTKELRHEFKKHLKKNHLGHMADHKASTALSAEEQAALKTKKLEEDH